MTGNGGISDDDRTVTEEGTMTGGGSSDGWREQ